VVEFDECVEKSARDFMTARDIALNARFGDSRNLMDPMKELIDLSEQ
jgi:hypothetical protein